MHRIDTPNARPNLFGAGKSGYHNNNDLSGVDPTALDPDALNALQEELCTVIEAANIELEKGTNGQLLAAIRIITVNTVYPVGIKIKFAADLNPNDLWPGTTWERASQGRISFGYEEGNEKFGNLAATGGSVSTTLSTNELPNFSLKIKTGTISINNDGDADSHDRVPYNFGDSPSNPVEWNTSTIGGGQAFDILPPYDVECVWERTD